MAEILMAIGLGAKELFNYNRETYKFDQDQRLEREQLRLEMQVKRFELFREDVRDLVELTVGRMDVYHLVGALFLEFCVSFFCEGRVQASAPPFLLSLFLLSNACAFVYLLLAVWLSMHASIASHSFGVRLLTRFVRLPIPSPKQIMQLSSRLADFESQGLDKVLRIPGVAPTPTWVNPDAGEERNATSSTVAPESEPVSRAPLRGSVGAAASSASAGAAPLARDVAEATGAVAGSTAGAADVAGVPRDGTLPAAGEEVVGERRNLLGGGEVPFSGEEMLLRPAAATPGLHVQLFRKLQAKWQCYDAYCRVCMALGVNQILQGLSYYAIVHTLVENRSPSAGYALLLIFQSAAVAVLVLDVAGLRRHQILLVQAVGALPAFLAASAAHRAQRTDTGSIDPNNDYPSTPAMFLLQTVWLEALLYVAAPSHDDASLPRRFRTVLFLDVFGDGADPTEAEGGPPVDSRPRGWGSQDEQQLAAERVGVAESALAIAEAAVRRWQAAPQGIFTEEQQRTLGRLRTDLTVWRRALGGELAWRAAVSGDSHDPSAQMDFTIRPWGELLPDEREDDPFAGFLLGPFEHDTGYHYTEYFYDLEHVNYLWDSPKGRPVLTMEAASSMVRGLEAAVRLLLAMGEKNVDATFAGAAMPLDPDSQTPEPPNVLGALAGVALGVGVAVRRFCWRCRHRAGGLGLHSNVGQLELTDVLDRPLLHRSSSGGSSGSNSGSRCRSSAALRGQHHKALAGPHAQHFVPERLPWQVLRKVTRVLQVAWGFTGTMAVLRELGIYRIDFQHHEGQGRRLLEKQPPAKPPEPPGAPHRQSSSGTAAGDELQPLAVEPINAVWPMDGRFFEAEGVSCLPAEYGLLLSTPFASYFVRPQAPQLVRTSTGGAAGRSAALPRAMPPPPLHLEELSMAPPAPLRLQELSEEGFPAGSIAFCAPGEIADASRPCLMGAITPAGLAIWPWNSSRASAVVLPVVGKPWTRVSGCLLRCSGDSLSDLVTAQPETLVDEWCLVLAGWDGGGRLPLALVPLPSGAGWPPAAGSRVRPRASVPLARAGAVLALHLAPRWPPRLWALLPGGVIEAWSLATPSPSASGHPPSRIVVPADADWEPKALCEDAVGSLVVLAETLRPPRRPLLLRTAGAVPCSE